MTLEKPAQWARASVHSSVSEGAGYLTALGFGEMQSVTRHIITFKDDLQPLERSRCLERTLGSHGSKTLLEAVFIFAAAHAAVILGTQEERMPLLKAPHFSLGGRVP